MRLLSGLSSPEATCPTCPIEPLLHLALDLLSLGIVFLPLLLSQGFLLGILHLFALLVVFKMLFYLLILPIPQLFFVFIFLLDLFVLLSRLDPEVLHTLVLTQVVVMYLHLLGLTLFFGVLGRCVWIRRSMRINTSVHELFYRHT